MLFALREMLFGTWGLAFGLVAVAVIAGGVLSRRLQ
jgi:hypothetical protein